MTETTKGEASAWAGAVPTRWAVKPLKRTVRLINKKTTDHDRPYVGLENIESGTAKRLDGADTLAEGIANLFEPGDVLFNKLRPYLAKVLVADSAGRCTSELLVLRPTTLTPDFAKYTLLSGWFIELVNASTFGTKMPRTDWAFIGNILIPEPPLQEQRRVTSFLDRKTAAIDSLIAKKERLIELLQEKRQALITQAVTNGINPNVHMRSSGDEWSGDVPRNWSTVRLSYVARVLNGSTPDRTREDYWEGGTVPWLSSGKVNDFIVTEADQFITPKALAETSVQVVPPGAVLVGMIGEGRTRGMSAYLAIGACINQNMAAVVPGPRAAGRFLHLVFIAAYEALRNLGRGGQQDALNCEILRSFRLSLPPREEQARIIHFVELQLTRLDSAVDRLQTSTQLLGEYRQAIISAAVTGQIDLSKETA